jgi:D-alanine transaminase
MESKPPLGKRASLPPCVRPEPALPTPHRPAKRPARSALTLSRTVYVNGVYVPEEEAKVSIFDRAFLFGDAVYEVTAVLGGRLVDFDAHLSRLDRSLREIDLDPQVGHEGLREVHEELIALNKVDEGIVYLEISRGPADRDFVYPEAPEPTVVAFTQTRALLDNPYVSSGIKVVTIPDIRWKRRDIKSTAMLAQAMGKQAAKRQGAYEAWMVEDGFVTEGTSSSAFILDAGGTLRTQPLGPHILPGVTRRAVLRLASQEGLRVEERPFSVEEAYAAREAFLTAASAFVLPIVEIDGRPVGDGTPGPVARAFRQLYIDEARKA